MLYQWLLKNHGITELLSLEGICESISLFQHLLTIMTRFFSDAWMEFPLFQFVSISSLGTTEKSLLPSLIPYQMDKMDKIVLSILFSRLHCRCGLPVLEQKGWITSLNMLVKLFLMHLRRLLAFFSAKGYCRLVANLLSIRTPISLSAKLLSISLAFGMHRAISPHLQDLPFFSAHCHQFPVGPSL